MNGFGNQLDVAVKLLKQVVELLEKEEIKYCLISGTLLGHVRHNGFIPWDDDIDLLVDGPCFTEKFKAIVERYDKRLSFFFKSKYDATKICFIKTGMPIDGKRAKKWEEHTVGTKPRRYHWPFVDLFAYYPDARRDNIVTFFNNQWDKKELFPFQKAQFMGINVCIPKNPDYFLKINYGNNYMTEFVKSNYSHKEERTIDRS